MIEGLHSSRVVAKVLPITLIVVSVSLRGSIVEVVSWLWLHTCSTLLFFREERQCISFYHNRNWFPLLFRWGSTHICQVFIHIFVTFLGKVHDSPRIWTVLEIPSSFHSTLVPRQIVCTHILLFSSFMYSVGVFLSSSLPCQNSRPMMMEFHRRQDLHGVLRVRALERFG